jgi:hypothetical protein
MAPSDYRLFPGLKKTIEREVGQAKDLSAPRHLRFDSGVLCWNKIAFK